MAKKQTSRRKKTNTARSKKFKTDDRWMSRLKTSLAKFVNKFKQRVDDFLQRRPHRSFRRTERRDYVRSLNLPGYWSFTNYVRSILWQHKKIFALLAGVYAILSLAFVGLASQDTYSLISKTLQETSGGIFEGASGEVGKAGLLLLSGITGNFNGQLTEVQQLASIIFGLMLWLATVWLLRSILAGHKPKLRDGLYNSGAPIISTFLVFAVLLVQMIPIAFATLVFFAAASSGIFNGGVEAMMISIGIFLLATLSVYWFSSTMVALVVVTIPGTYPFRAIRIAGDLVVGRRFRILLRLIWMILIAMIVWIVVMIPIILFDAWIKGVWQNLSWIPIVPMALLLVSSVGIVWLASYVYLLYRKVVEDDASPA